MQKLFARLQRFATAQRARRYLGRNERPTCICGAEREPVSQHVWKVSNKTRDLIYPEFMFRCPLCETFSAVNLYFPIEKYEEHDLDTMFIDDTKRRLNAERLSWISERAHLSPNAVLYDLGAGEGCFAHTFGAAHPSGRVYAIEGDAKLEAKFYGTLPNVTFVNEYVEPFLQRAVTSNQLPQADLMVLTDVMEHVIKPEDVLALMQRALAPGGLAYITVPDAETFSDPAPEHIKPNAIDWPRANRTCQHLWMMPPAVVQKLVGTFFEIVDVSGYEENIRRDSHYTTVLGRRKH